MAYVNGHQDHFMLVGGQQSTHRLMARAPAGLAMHQGTTGHRWGFAAAVAGYARHGIHAMTVQRHTIATDDVAGAWRLLDDHGIAALGLSRIGGFAANTDAAVEDGRGAVALATELGARYVVTLAGGLPAHAS